MSATRQALRSPRLRRRWAKTRGELAALFLLDADAPPTLRPVLRAHEPVTRALLDASAQRLERLDEGVAFQALSDLRTLLGQLFAGSFLLRQAPAHADAEAEVSLAWRHRGEEWLAAEEAFVHPALGDALRARSEAWLRTQLVDLDALADPTRVLALGERLAAIRALAEPLLQHIGRLEDQRLALWRRPRRVVRAAWSCCLRELPPELHGQVAANPAQRAAWAEAFDATAPSQPAAFAAFAAAHPTLPLDTAHFPPAFVEALLEGLGELDVPNRGVLIEGDNAPGLRFLAPRFAERVQCAYLDPPFNTTSRAWAYADDLPRATWLCLLDERVGLVRELLRPDGTLYAHIDQHEKERLRLLLDGQLHYIAEIIWRIGWVSGFKTRARKFIRNHDTIYQYGRARRPLFIKHYLPYPEGYRRRDGKLPTGKGIPLEDTWNCSAADRLDSIQIMSFSREKVGRGDLTQKNENLLERMLTASSRAGDWVLDPYLGSGTSAAAAHKLGRSWVGIEAGPVLREHALPRLQRVLWGEPYGISRAYAWQGGGRLEVLTLETHAQVAARADAPGQARPPGPLESLVTLAWHLGIEPRRLRRAREALVLVGSRHETPTALVWPRTGELALPPLAELFPAVLDELGWEEQAGEAFFGPGLTALELPPAWELRDLPQF